MSKKQTVLLRLYWIHLFRPLKFALASRWFGSYSVLRSRYGPKSNRTLKRVFQLGIAKHSTERTSRSSSLQARLQLLSSIFSPPPLFFCPANSLYFSFSINHVKVHCYRALRNAIWKAFVLSHRNINPWLNCFVECFFFFENLVVTYPGTRFLAI